MICYGVLHYNASVIYHMNSLYRKINLFITLILCCSGLIVGSLQTASALGLDTYASDSRLSQGRWVKIAVDQTGMYLLTDKQLRAWGFSNPSNVNVYGYGGKRLPDRLDKTYIDDLPQTPSEYIEGKGIVFFGEGPTAIDNTGGVYMRPQQNPFTLQGYYFLSETAGDERFTPAQSTLSSPSATASAATTYRELSYHETEAVSPGLAGFLLVGEVFQHNKPQQFKLQLPDVDTSRPVNMEIGFVARLTTQTGKLTITANGTDLPFSSSDNINTIDNSQAQYEHGRQTKTQKEFTVSGPTADIGIRFYCTGNVNSANLDYIALTYNRFLTVADGNPRIFYAANSPAGFRLAGADEATRVWDVTESRNASAMNLSGVEQGGTVVWSQSNSGTRRYAAWRPNGNFFTPQLVGEVRNQNLHALSDIEMVIITPSLWKDQADRLAELHRADPVEPLNVLVLTPEAIYNEFSSGAPDAQAFRKLLKMLYDRQAGTEHPLRHVLFFSRPFCDYRGLTSESKLISYPLLPCWFTDSGLSDNSAYTADNIFGMLEDNSGQNMSSDRFSIGIGRLPATSKENAKLMVDKIYSYTNKRPSGNWQNNFMLTADDGNGGCFMTDAERMYANLLKSNGGSEGFYRKIYIDQYEKVGNSYPQAHKELFRAFDEGLLWWVFIGHGAPTSLTGEGLMSFNDLHNMYCKRWPIFFGATCSFLHWDQMDLSGCETLFSTPNGGIIGAISPARPTGIADNGNISAAYGKSFFKRDAKGNYMTLGDIHRDGMNNIANSTRLRYVVMGDPALRPAIPNNKVIVSKIDKVNLPYSDSDEPPTLMARQQTVIEGYVATPAGELIADFNGSVVATIFDAEESYTTNGNGPADSPGEQVTYDQQGARLFMGTALVNNGRFSLQVEMPAEVANIYRNAAINIFATDGNGREAIGVNRDFYVYGIDTEAIEDVIPPTIESFYLNHPSFVSGDAVNSSPMVIAEISDDRVINLSTSGVGHQIALYLDNGSQTFADVSSYFTPYADGTPGGTIVYPLENLAVGDHNLRLRIWDSAPNSAEATIDFTVAKQITPTIYDVFTDTNPASTAANFYVSHDRPDRDMTVTIEVFDMMGRRVWQATQSGRSDMFQTIPITWDLTDYGGHRVGRGIYLYRATVSDADSGERTATASRRLAVTAQ